MQKEGRGRGRCHKMEAVKCENPGERNANPRIHIRLFPNAKCLRKQLSTERGERFSQISCSGGNFGNLVDKLFMGRFPFDMMLNKINKIPTTTRNRMV